jgi:hypothetical protein
MNGNDEMRIVWSEMHFAVLARDSLPRATPSSTLKNLLRHQCYDTLCLETRNTDDIRILSVYQ